MAAPSLRRLAAPALVFVVCAAAYCAVSGPRLGGPSPNAHYVVLAESWLHGRLDLGHAPPGTNDWACFDTVTRGPCPPGRYAFGGAGGARYRWYVSFPPFPALVILPAVALFGPGMSGPLFWALLAGLAPALCFVVLRRLREAGAGTDSVGEDVVLTAAFAFGSVFFFTAVQGSVWYAAHVVAGALLFIYLLAGFEARRPVLAGVALGLCVLTRPTTALLAVFFALEALRVCRARAADRGEASRCEAPVAGVPSRMHAWLRGADWPRLLRRCGWFALPIVVIGAVGLAYNYARFGDPLEFGHTFLQIRWRPRIEKWGLFNYHYLAKNLSVMLAGLPWLSARPPHLQITGHGLALWLTSPWLLWALWPRRTSALTVSLWAAVLPVAVLDLMYQNSGWVQFGYRFALDYLPLVVALIAVSGRRLRGGFVAAVVFAVCVNAFGAVTFDRAPRFYHIDPTQQTLFQPD